MSQELIKSRDNLPEAQPATDIIQVIERVAMNPDADIEKMKALLDMKERIDAKEAERKYNEAMVRAQKKMPSIAAKAYNEQTRSFYAKLEAVIKKITPVYTAEGFSLSFGEGKSEHEGYFRTICIVSHRAGHKEEFYYDLPLDDVGIKGTKNKTEIHAKASSTSYAQRYITKMIFNLSIGEEDKDGNKPSDTITEEQVMNLEALITEVGADKEKFLKAGHINSLEELPASKYKNAVAKLEAKRQS